MVAAVRLRDDFDAALTEAQKLRIQSKNSAASDRQTKTNKRLNATLKPSDPIENP